jgi:hypothetical protein
VKSPTTPFVSFLQATGIVVYCGLVGWLMVNGNKIFGNTPSFIGPVAFLLLFVVSASICSLSLLGYPFWLFWEKKNTPKAISTLLATLAWLIGYTITALVILFLSSFSR